MDKKNLILNIVIGMLIIAIVGVVILICTGNTKQESNEEEYREKVKENIIYEYITKPQEEQEKMQREEEQRREEQERLEENLIKQQELENIAM